MAAVETMLWLEPARTSVAALRARGTHAILLHGPAGVGKWDLAMSIARDALCETVPASGRACGNCPSCALTAAGNHPDLRVIVPDALAERRPGLTQEDGDAAPEEGGSVGKARVSREIRIDQVRDLVHLTGISAHRGGARVIVLGPAEALNHPAANALLKGLEEPPPVTLFLLVSDRIDGCLPTILSRCVLVRVAAPARTLALRWLESQGAEGDLAQRLTEAGGAPLAVLRQDMEGGLDPQVRAGLLSLLRRGSKLSAADVASGVPRTLPIGASVALFQRWAWDYFSYRLGGALRYHPGDAACFTSLAALWSLEAAGRWLDALRVLSAVADHPLNARAAVEGVLLEYVDSIGEGVAKHRE